MRAFDKILIAITRPQLNGHAMANIRNIESLAKAKEELEQMLKAKKKKEANYGTNSLSS
ncbi:MAG: hypothetical protein PHE67_10480 [Campylobacterales bacterium]|nr:hypothetical protein [Campylobacterales bacterium]